MVHEILGLQRVTLRPASEWMAELWPIAVDTSPKLFIHRVLNSSHEERDQQS